MIKITVYTTQKNYLKTKESIPIYASKIVLTDSGRVGETCRLKRLDFQAVLAVECSKVANGLQTLKENIEGVIAQQITNSSTEIPEQWYRGQNSIAN